MAKNSIRDYSATNSSNTDIQSIDISEGCSPAGINNAIREVMADLKDVSTGAVALESPAADSLSVTGDLTVDTNTLYVDSTNNNVGIGTTSPSTTIEAVGSLDILQLTGTTANAFARFTDNDASSDFSIGADDNTGAGAGAFMIYDRNNTAYRMVLDSSGNVGIGGTATANGAGYTTFGVNGSTAGIIEHQANGVRQAQSYATTSAFTTGSITAIPMTFGTGNTERMRIDSSGALFINRTSTYSYANGSLCVEGTGGNPCIVAGTSGTSFYNNVVIGNGNGNVGSISTNGSSTSFNTSSDYRLKENVVADWDATTRLKQLNPVRFNFIADPDTTVDGFLAHEVQTVVPEAISGTKDAMRDEEYEVTPAVLDEDGNEVTPAVMGTRSVPDYQGIDQSKLVPLLVKTIQELEARITALEAN